MQEVMSFVTVLVTDILVAGSIAGLYAIGLRLWARGKRTEAGTAEGVMQSLNHEPNRHVGWLVGSALCFAGCAAIVIYALYLMIPFFH